MSRIRSIKTEWLDDELMTSASDAARVLSVALICLADDYGNGRAGRAHLAGRVFPGRPLETLDDALRELQGMRYTRLYGVDGQRYFTIRTWNQHQRVDRPGAPKVPGPELATIEYDSDIEPPDKSQEKDAGPQELPGEITSTHASPSYPSDLVLAPSDQPKPSGSARARRKPGAKSEHVPFPMHDLWAPGVDLVDALAERFSVTGARIASTIAEFRVFWKRRGDRRKHAGWERAFSSNIERQAKSGALYTGASPQTGGAYQDSGNAMQALKKAGLA